MKRHQTGISFTGFLAVLAVLGFVLFIGMKLFPMYQEYWSVQKALKNVATDDTVSGDAGSIRASLAKRFDVGYINSIKPGDIKIERASSGATRISVDYEVRKPLFYNLDIVGRFSAAEDKHSGGL